MVSSILPSSVILYPLIVLELMPESSMLLLFILLHIYLLLNLEGHWDGVYQWMMVSVWQFPVKVLMAFHAPCIVVCIVLTKLLRLYVDSPCTRLLLWVASLLLGLPAAAYFCKGPTLWNMAHVQLYAEYWPRSPTCIADLHPSQLSRYGELVDEVDVWQPWF